MRIIETEKKPCTNIVLKAKRYYFLICQHQMIGCCISLIMTWKKSFLMQLVYGWCNTMGKYFVALSCIIYLPWVLCFHFVAVASQIYVTIGQVRGFWSTYIISLLRSLKLSKFALWFHSTISNLLFNNLIWLFLTMFHE